MMEMRISNVALLCWGMVFSVDLLMETTAHVLSLDIPHSVKTVAFASSSSYSSQQRFSKSSDVTALRTDRHLIHRRTRSQSPLMPSKFSFGSNSAAVEDAKKASDSLSSLSLSSSSSSSSSLSSLSLSSSASSSSVSLSSSVASSSLASSSALSSSASSSSLSSSLSSSSNSVLFGRPGGKADSVTTALEYMEGTLIASEVAKCENLPLLDQFKDELDKQSFNTFDSEGIGPVRVANTLTRLSLMSSPSLPYPKESSGRDSFHSVLLGGLLSQSKVLAGAAIVLSRGATANPNNTRHIYVYPKENHYVTMDTVSEQRRKVYSAMLQQYLNNNNHTVPSNHSPDDGYVKLSDETNKNRIQFKSVNFQAGSWSHIYFDCNLTKSWLLSYAAPYLDSKGAYSGIVVVDIDLTKVQINQCARDGTLFSNSHKCRLETTQCIAVPVVGKFKRGSYRCQCKPGYYFPMINASHSYFNGTLVENQLLERLRNGSGHSNHFLDSFQCLPCRKGCPNCVDDQPCFVEYNILLRGIPLGIQSFCMTITIVLGLVVFRLRKTKVICSSFWAMLELLLIGSLLLYSTVVIRYFEPTTLTCLLVPWFREVGFTIVYGVLLLKMYRLLADFQSRKAHRVHVQDKDLLKYLLLMVIVVLGYMAAWTAVNLDHVNDNVPLVTSGVTVPAGLKYFVCRAHWWDYVIEILEVLFLIFGIYLCYCVRSAPSDYGEGRYITIAICNETLISTVLYFARHGLWLSLDPDYLFLMYFMRCQLTVTVTLILLLGPKLWYVHRPPDEEHIRQRAYSQSDVHDSIAQETMKLNIGISSNGDVDVGEINLADMDPEDIRAELKRLYTQLQIYKTKTMRKDNPHISKRRGGRKQTHRRFSLQAFHHKHRHHHDHEHDHEISKTPEESTNSAEAVAISMETSGKTGDETHESRPGPSVSFKSAHK